MSTQMMTDMPLGVLSSSSIVAVMQAQFSTLAHWDKLFRDVGVKL